jgi:uncharacterized membrane protein
LTVIPLAAVLASPNTDINDAREYIRTGGLLALIGAVAGFFVGGNIGEGGFDFHVAFFGLAVGAAVGASVGSFFVGLLG